jgi:hypothetical protein
MVRQEKVANLLANFFDQIRHLLKIRTNLGDIIIVDRNTKISNAFVLFISWQIGCIDYTIDSRVLYLGGDTTETAKEQIRSNLGDVEQRILIACHAVARLPAQSRGVPQSRSIQ